MEIGELKKTLAVDDEDLLVSAMSKAQVDEVTASACDDEPRVGTAGLRRNRRIEHAETGPVRIEHEARIVAFRIQAVGVHGRRDQDRIVVDESGVCGVRVPGWWRLLGRGEPRDPASLPRGDVERRDLDGYFAAWSRPPVGEDERSAVRADVAVRDDEAAGIKADGRVVAGSEDDDWNLARRTEPAEAGPVRAHEVEPLLHLRRQLEEQVRLRDGIRHLEDDTRTIRCRREPLKD